MAVKYKDGKEIKGQTTFCNHAMNLPKMLYMSSFKNFCSKLKYSPCSQYLLINSLLWNLSVPLTVSVQAFW